MLIHCIVGATCFTELPLCYLCGPPAERRIAGGRLLHKHPPPSLSSLPLSVSILKSPLLVRDGNKWRDYTVTSG